MKTSFPPDTPYIDHNDLLTLTELKAQAEAAQVVGEEIVALTDRQFRQIPLDDGALRDAILEARRLRVRSARVRQLQFIGKLMRSVDLLPLRKALADVRSERAFVSPQEARVQAWVGRLVTEGAAAIAPFLAVAPAAERTRLSQLLRQYAKDRKQNKVNAQRGLLSYVQEELASSSATNLL